MRELHAAEIQHVSGGNTVVAVVAIGPIVASQAGKAESAESKD